MPRSWIPFLCIACISQIGGGCQSNIKSNGSGESIGSRPATFEGVAYNYKAGAGLEPSPGPEPIYVDNLDRWPEGVEGKRVRLTGTLVERKDIPDPILDEQGRAISAGMVGPRKVVTNPSWEVVE